MRAAYVLTATAEAELRDIIGYTFDRWGDRQAEIYSAKLLTCMDALAAGHGAFKDMTALYPGLRTDKCGQHYIFGLMRDDRPPLIIALLHERMDIIMRLGERLR